MSFSLTRFSEFLFSYMIVILTR